MDHGYAVLIQMLYRPWSSQTKEDIKAAAVHKNSEDMCSDSSNWIKYWRLKQLQLLFV